MRGCWAAVRAYIQIRRPVDLSEAFEAVRHRYLATNPASERQLCCVGNLA